MKLPIGQEVDVVALVAVPESVTDIWHEGRPVAETLGQIGIGGEVPGKRDSTVANVQETKEFCWNLVTMDLAKQMNATAAHVAREVDEFTTAGLTAAPSRFVNVPRVAESPVSFECKLSEIIQLKAADGGQAEAWLTLAEVVAVHIDKAFIYQAALARPIVRAGQRGDYFEIRPDAMFEMLRPD